MDKPLWLIRPIYIFFFLISALAVSLFLYIYWYIEISTALETVLKTINLDPAQVLASKPWMVIMVLSLLAAMTLTGMFMVLVYFQNTLKLYHMQQNFINNFTHELKTPVTSLKLYLETFLKYEIPREEQVKYISFMLQDVSRLSENISGILEIARLESRNYKPNFEKTDLSDLIRNFYKNNRHLFGDCEVTIDDKSLKKLKFNVDYSLFDTLLMNLTTNAIKYNDSSPPKLRVTIESVLHRLQIKFSDNGIGIHRTETTNIFNKFYQIGRADTMSAKGSGLGLHMVQNIIQMHKWKIRASSKGLKQGSDFIITIPRTQVLAAIQEKHAAKG